jgi:hypothetical protein
MSSFLIFNIKFVLLCGRCCCQNHTYSMHAFPGVVSLPIGQSGKSGSLCVCHAGNP